MHASPRLVDSMLPKLPSSMRDLQVRPKVGKRGPRWPEAGQTLAGAQTPGQHSASMALLLRQGLTELLWEVNSQDQPAVALFGGRIGQLLPKPPATFDDAAVVSPANAVGQLLDFFYVAAAQNDIVGHRDMLQRRDDFEHGLLPLFGSQL